MRKHLLFYYCISITALSLICGYADDSAVLVGSWEKTNGIINDATNVVLAKFIDIKGTDIYRMNGREYDGHITILQTLKGADSGNLAVVFRVGLSPKNVKEPEPNLNDTYIMILIQHHGIRKLLPATDDNIAKIKALIAAAPPSK